MNASIKSFMYVYLSGNMQSTFLTERHYVSSLSK